MSLYRKQQGKGKPSPANSLQSSQPPDPSQQPTVSTQITSPQSLQQSQNTTTIGPQSSSSSSSLPSSSSQVQNSQQQHLSQQRQPITYTTPQPQPHQPQSNSTPASLIDSIDTPHTFTTNLRRRNNQSKYILLVHCCQKETRTLRLLKLLRPIIIPPHDCTQMKIYFDFEMSSRCSALLLPMSLHSTQRDYIRKRIRLYLRTPHELKFLIVLCDHPTPEHFLTELNMLALQNNIGLIMSFSENETARYLESFTVLEELTQCGTTNLEVFNAVRHVSTSSSGGYSDRTSVTNQQRIENIFRTIPTISVTTMINVIKRFKSLRSLSQNLHQVNQALGVGEVRANLIQQAFTQPFSKVKAFRQEKLGIVTPASFSNYDTRRGSSTSLITEDAQPPVFHQTDEVSLQETRDND